MRAEGRHVAGDVRRPAGTFLGALHVDHRHGGLRRDAAHVAEPVAVQHHVARDQDPDAREVRQPHPAALTAAGCTCTLATCVLGRPIAWYSRPWEATTAGS